MDEREQQRKIRHRLAVLRHAEEVTGSVSATCRYYGITRQCFYKWRRRYEDEGEAGYETGPRHRFIARTRRHPRSSGRSSTSASTTTSGRSRFRCT